MVQVLRTFTVWIGTAGFFRVLCCFGWTFLVLITLFLHMLCLFALLLYWVLDMPSGLVSLVHPPLLLSTFSMASKSSPPFDVWVLGVSWKKCCFHWVFRKVSWPPSILVVLGKSFKPSLWNIKLLYISQILLLFVDILDYVSQRGTPSHLPNFLFLLVFVLGYLSIWVMVGSSEVDLWPVRWVMRGGVFQSLCQWKNFLNYWLWWEFIWSIEFKPSLWNII